MDSLPLAPELDRSALVGSRRGRGLLGVGRRADRRSTSARRRTQLDDVRAVLPATADPEHPEAVKVSRPSDAIEARAAAASAFTTLFLGLGAVAVLVGALGIANVMLMAVLERRNEIGLRRALGATRGHIVGQFLAEAVLLAGVGGVVGALLGSAVAAAYAVEPGLARRVAGRRRWSVASSRPTLVGALAGFYPALRAANTPPTDALRA